MCLRMSKFHWQPELRCHTGEKKERKIVSDNHLVCRHNMTYRRATEELPIAGDRRVRSSDGEDSGENSKVLHFECYEVELR